MKRTMQSLSVLVVLAGVYSLGFISYPLVNELVAQGTEKPLTGKERLAKSPRHQEWIQIKNGARTVHAFAVYPESKEKAPVIIAIHENKGLTDWAMGLADQLAEAGCIAIAPDLLSEMAPNKGKTSDFANEMAATTAIGQLSMMPDQVKGDLNAIADYALKIPSTNGKLAVCGFCWGGGQAFTFATNRPDLKAAFVFYGMPPSEKEMEKIQCPVYGFYGGTDMTFTSKVPDTEKAMKKLNKTFEPVVYEGAGHGFMRAGEENPTGANGKARNEAWERWKTILKKL